MLHVGVAESERSVGAGAVGRTHRAAAVGDDECGLILRKHGREFRLGRLEVDRAGNTAFGKRFTAVDVEDRDRLGGDGSLEVGV